MGPSPRSTGGQLPLDKWEHVKAVFLAALDVADAQREAFVRTACAGDEQVALEVLSLLERDRLADKFCETPAANLLGTTDAGDAGAVRLEPGTRLGPYELTGFIGAGGMGQVYRARDTRLGREVAIKTVAADAAPLGAARRLAKEARHISSLEHPNICTVYEIGECHGTPYIAMKLVEGRTLSELQRDAPPSLPDAIRYGMQVADALHHAHGRGIVHRDLKSSNVIVDGAGQAIVLDFGLAARLPQAGELSDSLTASHQGPAGTLTHMAPEVLLGGRGDARSDIWSLGVLLYQLVTGRLPFGGRTAFETSSAILGERPAPMDRRIPLALRLVIERCLARSPDERYQQAVDVKDALHGILAQRGWRVAMRLMRPTRRRITHAAAALLIAALALFASRFAIRQAAAVPPSFGTIAVLPLENASGNPSEDFYASGVTDALIAQLGGAGDVRVISRTSAIHARATHEEPKEIGRQLGAEAILQGTFSRSADRVRLDLRLLDVAREKVLWSDTFDRSIRDILVLQADAVRAVTAGVRAALRPGANERLTVVPAIRPDVYEAYLKGRYEWNRRTPESLATAMKYFSQAIDLDPTYAPAHAALADCYSQLGTVMVGTGSPREHRPRAETEAIKALQIDPASSEAHAALGYVRHYPWRWAESEQAFLRAIDLNPSNTLARLWYANLLMSRKRFDEALRQASAARDLDPFSLIVNTNVGWILTFAGRRKEAIDHLTRTVALDPEYPQARWRLADALMLSGRYEEALVHLEAALRVTDRSPSTLSMLAVLYARMGRHRDAAAVRRELLDIARDRYVPAHTITAVYRASGDIDAALDWLERSYEEGSNAVAYLAVEPWNEPLRGHPRFQALMRRTGQQ